MVNRGYEMNHYTYFVRQRLEAVVVFIKICKLTKCFHIKVIFFKPAMAILLNNLQNLLRI